MFHVCDDFNRFCHDKFWPFRLANCKLSLDDIFFTTALIDIYMLVVEANVNRNGDIPTWRSVMLGLADDLWCESLKEGNDHWNFEFVLPARLADPVHVESEDEDSDSESSESSSGEESESRSEKESSSSSSGSSPDESSHDEDDASDNSDRASPPSKRPRFESSQESSDDQEGRRSLGHVYGQINQGRNPDDPDMCPRHHRRILGRY